MNHTEVIDLRRTIIKAQLVALLVPEGDFNESVTKFVPSSFVSKYYKHFPYPDVVPGDYTSDQEDIKMLTSWLKDPIYDLPEKFDAFKDAYNSHCRKRNDYYQAQDLSILKKYLEYLVDALI